MSNSVKYLETNFIDLLIVKKNCNNDSPCRGGLVVSMSAFHVVGRGFAP